METTTVVRIPVSGTSPIRLEDIPLVNIGHGGTSTEGYKDLEIKLGRIPDLKSYKKLDHFSWTHRSLVGTLAKGVPDYWGGTWKRDYMLYLCVDERAGLPPNEYLNKVLDDSSNGRATRPAPIVYGEAFVFKKESKLQDPDVFERAEYTHMDQDFVDSAKYTGFRAHGILQGLLTVPTAGGFDVL